MKKSKWNIVNIRLRIVIILNLSSPTPSPKHFWGEGKIATGKELPIIRDDIVEWQWHLSKMVLEKEPLKYIEKFL